MAKIYIEIAYQQHLEQLVLEQGCTVQYALTQSALKDTMVDFTTFLTRHTVGIWSQVVPLDKALQDGDRIEIYRPILCDPKQARRKKIASD